MSTTAPATQPVATADQYVLHDETGKTNVTYYPFAPGPMRAGQTPGPELAYSGPKGNHTFRGTEVNVQDSPLGQMITVNLELQVDTGAVSFTLFLPIVVMGGSKSEAFSTFCVTATKPGNILKTGSQLQYDVQTLNGTARIIPLPL